MTEDHDAEPTQLTQPKGIDSKTGKPYEPVEIPVPKRSEWERVLGRVVRSGHQRQDQEQDTEHGQHDRSVAEPSVRVLGQKEADGSHPGEHDATDEGE
jgi:hypothetical protein